MRYRMGETVYRMYIAAVYAKMRPTVRTRVNYQRCAAGGARRDALTGPFQVAARMSACSFAPAWTRCQYMRDKLQRRTHLHPADDSAPETQLADHLLRVTTMRTTWLSCCDYLVQRALAHEELLGGIGWRQRSAAAARARDHDALMP